MALYGQAYINGLEIVDWEARRMSAKADEVNTYVVSVAYTDQENRVHNLAGVLEHLYADGALVLMSKVFAWAAQELE